MVSFDATLFFFKIRLAVSNAFTMVNQERYANILLIIVNFVPCSCATRVCAQSQTVLCSLGNCNVFMACEIETQGLNLHDGMKAFLDLRFSLVFFPRTFFPQLSLEFDITFHFASQHVA